MVAVSTRFLIIGALLLDFVCGNLTLEFLIDALCASRYR